jgi:Skp family chaperone for outer membrane proteins
MLTLRLMKAIPFACALILCSLVSFAGELKVATIDLQAVLKKYDRAKEAVKAFQVQEVSFAKELDGLKLEGQKLMREAEDLRASFNDPALSSTERESRRKQWEGKLQDLSAFSVRYDQVRLQKETEFRVSLERNNRRLMEEVVTVTRHIGEREGFNLVLNANRENPGAGEVVFSKGLTDITDKVLAALNEQKKSGN